MLFEVAGGLTLKPRLKEFQGVHLYTTRLNPGARTENTSEVSPEAQTDMDKRIGTATIMNKSRDALHTRRGLL